MRGLREFESLPRGNRLGAFADVTGADRSLRCRTGALVLSLVLLPLNAIAQDPPVLLPPDADFTGTWTGSGRFTNEWASPVCGYEGKESAIKLEIQSEGSQTKGTLTIAMKAQDPGCPPLKKQYDVVDLKVSGAQLAFVDPGGASWSLALHAAHLLGIVGWKLGPTDDPLAEGFKNADGSVPMTRLSGEVNLTRLGAKGTPAGPTGKTTGKATVLALGAIAIANVAAAGIILGVNKATKQTGGSSSAAECSPRSCTIGSTAGGVCLCNVQISQGASCQAATSVQGGSIGAGCFLSQPPQATDTPCAVGLSCNNNVCQDFNAGQCPPPS